MGYTEGDFIKMANDPKFMAERWKHRLASNEKELAEKSHTLSKKEKERKQGQLESMYKMVKKYEARAKK